MKKSTAASLQKELRSLAQPKRARFLRVFFKTGPGEYAEGDKLLGLTVPQQRRLAKLYKNLPLPDLEKLLRSPYHEERLTALYIAVAQFKKGDPARQRALHRLYLKNWKGVNNWDLVDSSAPTLLGAYLEDRDQKALLSWARSPNLWKRRMAMMATFHDIRRGEFGMALRLAKVLVKDREDLIHKAVGWMLREIGKRDNSVEEEFLKAHPGMPRTMLRYAIEKFPEKKRKAYLKIN